VPRPTAARLGILVTVREDRRGALRLAALDRGKLPASAGSLQGSNIFLAAPGATPGLLKIDSNVRAG
jgi:hypothetical protein